MGKRARSDSDPEVDAKAVSPGLENAQEALVSEVEQTPIEVFKHLLDMTHVPPGTEPSHFQAIATSLMRDFHLCVGSKSDPPVVSSYEFLEVEFYWYNQTTGHIDPFTHAAEEQRQGGNWYFHRAPRRVPPGSQSTAPVPSPKTSGFKGGTRKGLDLTFGTPVSPQTSSDTPVAYGGILLRALRNTSNQKVTCGPSLLVDEVLRAAGCSELTDLVGKIWGGDTSAFGEEGPSRVFLRPATHTPKSAKSTKDAPIYTSPRIGLELSRIETAKEATSTHPRVQYVIRPYRFFKHPRLLGSARPQTFYGLFSQSVPRSQIADILNLKPMQVETFAGHVEAGRRTGKAGIREFVSEMGKGAAPSTQRFLKMAGVLECILEVERKENEDEGQGSSKKQKLGKTLTDMFAPKKSA
ncbi:hypothetical protein FRC12_007497 [Ceratobasidium sp. 428]|nr:hypothetical protein FRC12_007497 [Ceratobasidium sp. 428]